jgi:hypothetical protein
MVESPAPEGAERLFVPDGPSMATINAAAANAAAANAAAARAALEAAQLNDLVPVTASLEARTARTRRIHLLPRRHRNISKSSSKSITSG